MKTIPSLLALTFAATSTGQALDSKHGDALRVIEQKLVEKQRELGIPGMAVAIVKEDRVIYEGTFGYRDVEKKLPVTRKTLFRVGSLTKSFTSLLAMMAAEEGRLSITDHPGSHIPYFKFSDPAANQKVTLGHLLCHSTGLAPHAGDVALLSGKLDREEVIRTVCDATTIFSPGQGYGYSNIMYAAVGEALARVYKRPYEILATDRLLRPLGMKSSSFSLTEMLASSDHANGYSPRPPHKEVTPMDHSLTSAAGALNSNLEEMTRFLRLMLSKGRLEGNRFLSEGGWRALIEPRVAIDPIVNSAYGWVHVSFNGAIGNGGNTEGYNARIGLLPSHNLGFVLLMNVTDSPLKRQSEMIIWEHLAGKAFASPPPPRSTPETLREKYVSPITADELAAKVAAAQGKDSARLKLTFDLTYETDGITGGGHMELAPEGAWSSLTAMFAVGKPIVKVAEGSKDNLSPYVHILRTGSRLTRADFGRASLMDGSGMSIPWMGAEIVDKAKVQGEEAYAVVKKSAIGPIREYFSVESHLLLRRDDAAGGVQTFSDYRSVRGQMIPFTRTSVSSLSGRSSLRIRSATNVLALVH